MPKLAPWKLFAHRSDLVDEINGFAVHTEVLEHEGHFAIFLEQENSRAGDCRRAILFINAVVCVVVNRLRFSTAHLFYCSPALFFAR